MKYDLTVPSIPEDFRGAQCLKDAGNFQELIYEERAIRNAGNKTCQ